MRADNEELPATPPGIRARDITAALRHLYARAPIRTWADPDVLDCGTYGLVMAGVLPGLRSPSGLAAGTGAGGNR